MGEATLLLRRAQPCAVVQRSPTILVKTRLWWKLSYDYKDWHSALSILNLSNHSDKPIMFIDLTEAKSWTLVSTDASGSPAYVACKISY